MKSTINFLDKIPPARYIIEVEFMCGDADGDLYSSIEVEDTYFHSANCGTILAAIDGISKAYCHGDYSGQGNKYYEAIFGEQGDEEDDADINPDYHVRFEHPNDPQGDYQFETRIEGWKVTYRDEKGIVHPVSVTFDTDDERNIVKFNKEFNFG
jgi:hypothetical protein